MSWITEAKVVTKEQRLLEEFLELTTRKRREAILAARDSSELKQYTVAQATTYVNNKLDAATTVAAMKEAVRDILIKMIPYVLE